MTLDDDFSDDDASSGDLELDVPSGHSSSRSLPVAPSPADVPDHALPPPGASKKPPPAPRATSEESSPRLEETPPRYEHAAPLRHLISDRKYGCVAWLR